MKKIDSPSEYDFLMKKDGVTIIRMDKDTFEYRGTVIDDVDGVYMAFKDFLNI